VTNYGRKTENTTYQTSRVVKHTKLGQGAVKKLSLSILVDHSLRYDQGKPIVEAPTAEKLKVIKDLVTAAIGIDAVRGDILVVETFPFESTLNAQPLTTDKQGPAAPAVPAFPLPEWLQKLIGNFNPMVVIGTMAGVLLAVLGAVFLVWRRSRGKKTAVVETSKQLNAVGDAERELEARLADQVAAQQRQEAEAMLSLKIPTVSTKKTDVLTKHIASEVKKDPVAMAHVVRNWLNGDYQRR
jgi:flagellar M-ring protein FliF